MLEAPLLGQRAGLRQKLLRTLSGCGRAADGRLARRDLHRIAEHAIEQIVERLALRLRKVRLQPAGGVDEVEKTRQGARRLLDATEGGGALAHLGDVGIRQFLDHRHPARGLARLNHRLTDEEGPAFADPFLGLMDEFAEQAVAGAEVMVEEGERCADREGMEPEREFRQFHRHRIEVCAVDDALQHDAPHEVAVVEVLVAHLPAVGLRLGADMAAYGLDLGRKRRGILAPRHQRGGLLLRGEGFVGEPIDQRDQEVPGAHRGVEHTQGQEGFRRVEAPEIGEALFLRPGIGGEALGGLAEGGAALGEQRPDRAADDEADQLLRRVVAAGVLPGEGIQPDAGAVLHDIELEKPLVDGAEMLDGEIAEIDEAPGGAVALAGEVVEQLAHRRVGWPRAHQQRRGGGREQAAVVRRQAQRGVARVDGPAECGEIIPPPGERGRERARLVARLRRLDAEAPQRVSRIARVAHRQEVAILGVKNEQQAIEQNQRGVPRLGPPARIRGLGLRVGLGKRGDQAGEHAVEHRLGQGCGDPLLVAAALGQGGVEEGEAAGAGAIVSFAAKERQEGSEEVERALLALGGAVEQRGQVEADEALRPAAGAVEVEAPGAPVRQQPPADGAVRGGLGKGEVAENLRGGRPARAAAPVEGGIAGLVLHHHGGEAVAGGGIAQPGGLVAARGGGEEQGVGDVVAPAACGLLRQVVPAQAVEHGADEGLLGGSLVGLRHCRQRPPEGAQGTGLLRHLGGVQRPPFRRLAQPLAKVELGQQASGNHDSAPGVEMRP